MLARTPHRLSAARCAAFAGLWSAVLACALLLRSRLQGLSRPELVASGITIDLAVTVPVAFWLLVARARRWSALSAVPVAVLGLLLARALLPAGQRGLADHPEALAGFLELGVVAALLVRGRAARRRADLQGVHDPLDRIRAVTRDVLSHRGVSEVIATELAVLRFALLPVRPPAFEGTAPVRVTTHRRSSLTALVSALVLLTVAEGVPTHILLSRWSPVAAWVATALAVYGVLWLVAHLRATVHRPLLVGADFVHVRAGLLWNVRIPRERIRAVASRRPADAGPVLSTALLGTPNRWLVLDAPVPVAGPYGRVRRARAIGVLLDDASALDELGRAG